MTDAVGVSVPTPPGRPPAARPSEGVSGDPAVRTGVLEEVRRLVAADGAELELLSDSEDSSVVELRLVFPADCCQECVLPRAVLEDMVAHMFRNADPTVMGVRVHDPREHPAS